MNVIRIIQGHLFNALKINQSIHDYRVENGCMNCALAHDNDGKYTGYCYEHKGGCGCDMSAKARLQSVKCPENIWANDWFKPERLEEVNKQHNFTPARSSHE